MNCSEVSSQQQPRCPARRASSRRQVPAPCVIRRSRLDQQSHPAGHHGPADELRHQPLVPNTASVAAAMVDLDFAGVLTVRDGQRQLLWPLCANYFGRSGMPSVPLSRPFQCLSFVSVRSILLPQPEHICFIRITRFTQYPDRAPESPVQPFRLADGRGLAVAQAASQANLRGSRSGRAGDRIDRNSEVAALLGMTSNRRTARHHVEMQPDGSINCSEGSIPLTSFFYFSTTSKEVSRCAEIGDCKRTGIKGYERRKDPMMNTLLRFVNFSKYAKASPGACWLRKKKKRGLISVCSSINRNKNH